MKKREEYNDAPELIPIPTIYTGKIYDIIQKVSHGGKRDSLVKICFSVGRILENLPPETKEGKREECLRVLGETARFVSAHEPINDIDAFLADNIEKGTVRGGYLVGENPATYLTGKPDEYAVPGDSASTEDDNDDDAQRAKKEARRKLPCPPMQAFCDPLRNAIENIAQAKNVPVEMVLGLFISLASACMGRARAIEYSGDLGQIGDEEIHEQSTWREFGNLFMLFVSETGSGKSYMQNYIFSHLNKLENIKKEQYAQDRKIYEENMAMWKKKKDTTTPPPERPRNTQYILNDSTIEAAAERFEDNPRGMIWWQDEMSYFFDTLDRYNKRGGGAKARLLQCYDSGKWSISRRTKDGVSDEKHYPSVTLSLLGGIQPHLMHTLFSAQDTAQGVPQRFLFIRAIIDKPVQLPTSAVSKESYDLIVKLTESLINIPMNSNAVQKTELVQDDIIYITPEGEEKFTEFFNIAHIRFFDTPVQGYVSKLMGMTLRLALILHHMEAVALGSNIERYVSVQTMQNATLLADWLCEHTRKCLELMPAEKGQPPMPEYTNGNSIFEGWPDDDDEEDPPKQIIWRLLTTYPYLANADGEFSLTEIKNLIDKKEFDLNWRSLTDFGRFLDGCECPQLTDKKVRRKSDGKPGFFRNFSKFPPEPIPQEEPEETIEPIEAAEAAEAAEASAPAE